MDTVIQWILSPYVAGSITVISVILAVYSIIQQRRAQRQNALLRREDQTITWDDIRGAVADLTQQIRKKKGRAWRPDFLFSFSSRGGIVCEMMARDLCPGVPQLTGITIHKSESSKCPDIAGYIRMETLKWTVYIPEHVEAFHNCRLLLVDDYVQSGNDIRAFIKHLADKGIKPRELVTCAVVKAATAVSLADCVRFLFLREKRTSLFLAMGYRALTPVGDARFSSRRP